MAHRVVLCRLADLAAARRCLRLFWEHCNHRFRYPTWLVPAKLFPFTELSQLHHEFPWTTLPRLELREPYQRAFEHFVAVRFSQEYPDVDAVLRLDDRAELHSWVPYDPFQRLGDRVFGYRATAPEPAWRYKGLLSYLTARMGARAARSWPSPVVFESGFQVHRLDFWRTGPAAARLRELDADDCFFTKPWTAATVQTILLRAYSSKQQRIHLRDFTYAAGPRSWPAGT